jgi:hypothetical protein
MRRLTLDDPAPPSRSVCVHDARSLGITHHQLARLGFNGFAVDLVDAAPAVIAYLNGAAKLHMAVSCI